LVAGVDGSISSDRKWCIGAAVLWDRDSESVTAEATAVLPVRFPYVPGLLSFRELPAILSALAKLPATPEAVLCDAHGWAHMRRFGLACHLGVVTGRASVGCAKSRLVGSYEEPDPRRGSHSPLVDDGETIGTVLRTRDHVKPVFVSVGHLATIDSAVELVLACGRGYRLPEPTRLAHQLAARARRRLEAAEN
jgi:deoxyribonuclease V